MDTKLAWHLRLAVRIHLLYCVWCRRYTAQVHFLRRVGKGLAAEESQVPAHILSTEAKDQIRTRLREAIKPGPPTPE